MLAYGRWRQLLWWDEQKISLHDFSAFSTSNYYHGFPAPGRRLPLDMDTFYDTHDRRTNQLHVVHQQSCTVSKGSTISREGP
ncbi:hypothetical protein IAS59_005557 [Cryptococcus gattii]